MRLTSNTLTRIFESDVFQTLEREKSLSMDSTFFEDTDACEARGLLGSVLKLVANRNEASLVFGSAFHEALAHHYANPRTPLAELKAIALKHWRANPVLEDIKRNETSLLTLIESYYQHLLMVPDFIPVVHKGSRVVERGVEAVLAEVDGYQLKWKGKIDLVATTGNELWVVDHKTTSVMGEKFPDDKHRSNQMVGYTFLARQVLGLPVKGVIINAAAFRVSKKDGVSFDFQRFTLPITEHAVYEWAEETAFKLNRLRLLLLELKEHVGSARYSQENPLELQLPFVSTTRSSCVSKYGKCRFFDVCQAYQSHRDALLFETNEFKTSTFTPLGD